MKKLFFIAIALASLISCTKKKCWDCNTSYTPDGLSTPTLNSSTTYCDKNYWEIRKMEKEGSGDKSLTFHGNTSTYKASMNCDEQ